MEYVKSSGAAGGNVRSGAELMDYSMIDDSFTSSPRFTPNRANFVTLGSAPFSSAFNPPMRSTFQTPTSATTTPKIVPNIYPSLHITTDDELLRSQFEINDDYDRKLKTRAVNDEIIIADDDDDMVTSQDLSPGAFRNLPMKDGLSHGIELDSVKHKLSSFWNNVKYGKLLNASILERYSIKST